MINITNLSSLIAQRFSEIGFEPEEYRDDLAVFRRLFYQDEQCLLVRTQINPDGNRELLVSYFLSKKAPSV